MRAAKNGVEAVESGMGGMRQGYLNCSGGGKGGEGNQMTEQGTWKRRIWDAVHNFGGLGNTGRWTGMLKSKNENIPEGIWDIRADAGGP
jgi:hypothetical protein